MMFYAFFFMLIFVLMSGIFTPTESMPNWAQIINIINPYYYFMRVIRMIMLKGSGFQDILPQLIKITIYAIVMNTLAVVSYKKVV